MEIPVYDRNGEQRCVITSLEYHGEWMSECYVLFDIDSPEPIGFTFGDWLEYRGERFELHYEPEVVMQAMPGTYGAAYRYEKMKFTSLAEELVNCDFLDFVLNDNHVHFTGLPDFSFYAETVKELADRLQANMNRFCQQNELPYWEFIVDPEAAGKTRLNISATNISCFDALALVQNEFGLNYIIRGRKVTIGAEGVPAAHLFRMGKDGNGKLNGLYEFQRNADSDQKIVTRLRAYGSDRNLPRRYYNSLTDADGVKMVPDNMAVNRLMLPDFPYVSLDPYVDSENIPQLGVIEDTVIFDGSDDLPDIYPSIEEATADELEASGTHTTATGRLDEIVNAQTVNDDGLGTEKNGEIIPDTETFTIVIKDIGFDINEYLTDETPQISFKTGMLGGRDFNIRTGSASKPVQNQDKTWTLTLERVYDEAIGLWFPYNRYNAKPQDQFVILGIDMPETYVKMASQRLLKAAREYLKKNDFSRSVYTPKVDEIFMARQHQSYLEGEEEKSLYLTLKEGDLLVFEEESLDIGVSSIFIDKLTIEEGKGPVPTYEISLREEKSVGTLQRIQNQIDSIAKGGGGYNAEQIKQLILAIGNALFLSKRKNDRTPFDLTVGGLLKAEGLTTFGDFLSGLNGGFGGAVDNKGNAEFESIRVRSFMEIYELIVNRLSAIEGDQLLTEADTIEECILNDDGTYTLKLHEKWDGYITAQYQFNVIKGIYNNITENIGGEGTTVINNATMFTSWMNIISVDAANNKIRVSVYADDEVPAGRNFPPVAMMKIARWGNSGDSNDERYKMRQDCIELSSTNGRITKYMNVTKPIIDKGNIAFCMGKCPEFLVGVNQDIHLGDNIFYVDKVIAGQTIHVDYQGRPIPTIVYRGAWDENEEYYDGTELTGYNEQGVAVYERSVVEYFGVQWICSFKGTKTPPSWIGTAWTFYLGDTTLLLDFDSDESSVWVDDPKITLGVLCRISSWDLTNDPSIRWDWTRESWNNDTQDKASDEEWNRQHSNIGNRLTLVREDMNYSFGTAPQKLIYTVTATLLDVEGRPVEYNRQRVASSLTFELGE